MQCDICFRTGGQRLPFLCPTDARNKLYEPRIQHAKVLLESDELSQKVNDFLELEEKGDSQSTTTRPKLSRSLADRQESEDRTQQIITHADELRLKVDKARQEIAKKKAILERRKSELATVKNGVEARRTRQIDEVEKAIRITKYKWNQAHSVTASSRTFLCGEAAKLYGLRRVRRNGAVEEYKIGGIGIIDLRSMNSVSLLVVQIPIADIL